jgi:hypothetical protein
MRRSLMVLAFPLVACTPPTGIESLQSALTPTTLAGESHPYQDRLVCVLAPGDSLDGVMYDVSTGTPVEVTHFDFGGNVGSCELAIRAARNGKVCISDGNYGYTIRDLKAKTNSGSYSDLSDCTTITRGWPTLRTDPGYVEFIAPSELQPFLAALPTLSDSALDQALHSTKTMWYDEASLTFVYQDSFGDPKGLRGNRVGYDVGSNASEPDIHKLVDYFQPGHFKLPFSIAAGADFSENIYVMNFWLPPQIKGATAPVRIWQNNSHYQWVFPVGTVIGEVLFIQAPDDQKWFTFEVRARTRQLDHWDISVFRPYLSASALSSAIKALRPGWSQSADLSGLVTHLDDNTNLTAYTLQSPTYAALFPAISGAMDYLPETTDVALIKQLLTGKTFDKSNGTSFKSDGTKTAYAASTHARFHVVPQEYFGGMFEVSNDSCHRCHQQTSRPLGDLDSAVVLYGEVWGEDEVFSWHPFTIDEDTFSVTDGNRHLNPRFQTAGLVDQQDPSSDPTHYQTLAKPYTPTYE